MAIYFIRSGDTGPIKIGLAKDVRRRLSGLQTGHPERLHLLHLFDGGAVEERALHSRFKEHRIKGEWFTATQEILSGDVGLAPLAVEAKPAKKGRAGGGWTREAYARYLERLQARKSDPVAIERRKRAYLLTGATQMLRTGAADAVTAIKHLREADTAAAQWHCRRRLQEAYAKLESAYSRVPDVVDVARKKSADRGAFYARHAISNLHELASVLRTHGFGGPRICGDAAGAECAA